MYIYTPTYIFIYIWICIPYIGANPVVMESSPQKPKRVKEKTEKKKKPESNKTCDDLFDQVSPQFLQP